MKIIGLMLALAFLSGCSTNEWTRRDTMLQLAATASLAVDAYQTSHIRYSNVQEIGWVRPFCGPYPDASCTAEYFGTVAVSSWLISRLLPPSIRPYWQSGLIMTEAMVTVHNYQIGIR